MNFLDAIQMELSELDLTKLPKELTEPQFQVGKHDGEKIAGEVEKDTRKLWILYTLWMKMSMENMVEAQFCGDKKQSEVLMTRAKSLAVKSKLLSEVFWVSVNDSLELWEHNVNVGVRSGWKVVTIPPKVSQTTLSLLDLFGRSPHDLFGEI